MDIADRVQAFLSGFYVVGEDAEFKDEYQQIFADEGFRKANYILDDIKLKEKEHNFNLKDFAYLSIGGADGSEAEAILANCDISHAVVLEIDTPACNKARERGRALAANRILEVIEGDAAGRLDDAVRTIRARGAKGLVVSAQAILHEFPTRAPSFEDFNRFFGKLLGSFPLVILYAREPCSPYGWPPEVEVQVPGVAGENLKALLELIGKQLEMNTSGIAVQPRDFVLCNHVLLVETLHKLLRCKSLSNFKLEMGEQLTSFNVEEARSILLKHCVDPNLVESEQITTQGFKKAYGAAKVKARDPISGQMLQLPKTHASIIAVAKNENLLRTSRDLHAASIGRRPNAPATSSVRRGRIDSQISFSTFNGISDAIRVKERSVFQVTESQPNPYFQFGGTRKDILKIFGLMFSLQLGTNGPGAPAEKIMVLRRKPKTEDECAQLLDDVTEERTVRENEAVHTLMGLKEWVPLPYAKPGVQLITEAEYVVQRSRLFTWRVGVATEGYDLSIHYPSRDFEIQIEPFINWTTANSDIPNEKRYRSDELVRPENGVAWCFLPKSEFRTTEDHNDK